MHVGDELLAVDGQPVARDAAAARQALAQATRRGGPVRLQLRSAEQPPAKPMRASRSAEGLAGASLAAHGVNFIDKDDTRRVLFGLVKHVTHTGCADTDKHFHEVRTRNSKKRYFGFTCYGPGQQGFTRSRRTHHEDAARYVSTQFLELSRVAQEFN